MILWVCSLLVSALCVSPARAEVEAVRDNKKVEFQVDLGQTLMIPIGDSNYTKGVDPSYAASLRFAALFRMPFHLRLGPFFQIEGVAVNSSDSQYQNNGFDASFGRLRVLVGPHLGIRLTERVELWLRVGIGLDYFSGSIHSTVGNFQIFSGSSTAFALDPQLGTTVRVWRMLTLGGVLSFPIAFDHDFTVIGNVRSKFTAGDLALTILIGARL